MYSQSDEEKIILDHVPSQGRLLEIGAYNGKDFSNTLALIERGWEAVCIEADPGCFQDLKTLHQNNPKVELICALAGPGWALKKFYSTKGAVATTEEENYQKWKPYQADFRAIKLPQVPLDLLVEGSFDFVSIDTEGTSVNILMAIDWKAKGTKLICVEYDSHEQQAREWFESNGYEVIHRTGENLIAKLKE